MGNVAGFAGMVSGAATSAYDFAQREGPAFRGRLQQAYNSLQGTAAGRNFTRGAAMGLGWELKEAPGTGRLTNRGFLGLKGNVSYNSRIRAMGRMASRGGISAIGKLGFGVLLKAAGPLSLAYEAYSGYKEGGVGGAVNSAATGIGMWGAFEVGMGIITGSAINPLAIAAIGGYGGYKFVDESRKYNKRLKKLEMGAPIVDMFGTIATTRQRSLQALQNTHINGRMALGNEGMLIHTNIYSR